MKIIYSCLGLMFIGTVYAAGPTTSCPSGYIEVIEKGLFFSNGLSNFGTWPAGYGKPPLCYRSDITSVSPTCFVTTMTNTTYTESNGSYQYTSACPYTSGISPIGVAGTETGIKKCVRLSTTSACSNPDFDTLGVDWSVTCNGLTKVNGIGVCASTSGTSVGTTATALQVSANANDNFYCWCRMITPAVSKWIFINAFSNDGQWCRGSCSDYCANFLSNSDWTDRFNAPMFSNLE